MRRPAHIAVAAAIAAVLVLIAIEIGRGALGDGALALPDPCTRTVGVQGDGIDAQTQRIALTALDRAACDLGTSREQLLFQVANAVTEGGDLGEHETERLRDGLRYAIGAEEDAGRMNGATAWVLGQAVRFAPLDWVLRAIGELQPLISR